MTISSFLRVELLLAISEEAFAVDWPLEQAARRSGARRQEGGRPPMAVRDFGGPLAPQKPAQGRRVRLDRALESFGDRLLLGVMSGFSRHPRASQPPTANPLDRRALAHPRPMRRRTAAHAFLLNRVDHPIPQVLRIETGHPLASSPDPVLNQNSADSGIPRRSQSKNSPL